MKPHYLIVSVVAVALLPFLLFGQSSKIANQEHNVVYGMVSGSALLMNIYHPERPNHIGIILIPGSAWGTFYTRGYNDISLSDHPTLDTGYVGKIVPRLTQAGYTVFLVGHRFSPRFHFPEIFHDCQRAVRFVRFNANKFGIDPDHIGALGHSSGGNLASMLGVTDTVIAPTRHPLDSCSSKVQAVVSLATGFDLADYNTKADTTINNNLGLKIASDYLGELPEVKDGQFVLSGRCAAASPITFVTKDDAPFLIYASDNDPLIPLRQAKRMSEKLVASNVPAKLIIIPRARHYPMPDIVEVDAWYQKYLR